MPRGSILSRSSSSLVVNAMHVLLPLHGSRKLPRYANVVKSPDQTPSPSIDRAFYIERVVKGNGGRVPLTFSIRSILHPELRLSFLAASRPSHSIRNP